MKQKDSILREFLICSGKADVSFMLWRKQMGYWNEELQKDTFSLWGQKGSGPFGVCLSWDLTVERKIAKQSTWGRVVQEDEAADTKAQVQEKVGSMGVSPKPELESDS